MRKKTKASAVMVLLKKGYSVKEIKERIAVSDSYIWAVKKQMAEKPFTPKEVGVSEEAFVEAAVAASQGKDKVEPKHEPEVSVVDKVLDARAEQYGSFMQSSDTSVRIKGIMHNAVARSG